MPRSPEQLPTRREKGKGRDVPKKNLPKSFYGLIGIGAGVAAITGAVLFDKINPTQQLSETPLPTAGLITPDQNESADEKVIREEIIRRGIGSDFTEENLWRNGGYTYTGVVLSPEDPQYQQEVFSRVDKLIPLMIQSKNHILRESAEYIQPLILSQDVNVDLYLPDPSTRNKVAMRTYPKAEGEKVIWTIAINAEEVLNFSDSVVLATIFAHEVIHVQNGIAFINGLPSTLSAEEKVTENSRLRGENTQVSLEEEAHAFVTHSEAAIIQMALGYDYSWVSSDWEKDAAMYIKTGKNSGNQEWIRYVASRLGRAYISPSIR